MWQVNNLVYSVGKKVLLSVPSLFLEEGKMHCFLGPNGAGKTTLLQCLTLEKIPAQGCVFFNETPLSQVGFKALARNRAVLSQHNTLDFSFTVRQVMQLGFNVQANHLLGELESLAKELGLFARLEESYLNLSGGEQQRTHLGRVLGQLGSGSLVGKTLFLDEWTTNLDLKHIQQISALLQHKVSQGLTVVMVLHDIHLAQQLADTCYLLKDGCIHVKGPPAESLTPKTIQAVFNVKVRYEQRLVFK